MLINFCYFFLKYIHCNFQLLNKLCANMPFYLLRVHYLIIQLLQCILDCKTLKTNLFSALKDYFFYLFNFKIYIFICKIIPFRIIDPFIPCQLYNITIVKIITSTPLKVVISTLQIIQLCLLFSPLKYLDNVS